MALFYSQRKNYSPESFRAATKELSCLIQRKRLGVRGGGAECPHAAWECSGAVGSLWDLTSGTTCLKKARAGRMWFTSLRSKTQGPACFVFHLDTQTQDIISLCHFS